MMRRGVATDWVHGVVTLSRAVEYSLARHPHASRPPPLAGVGGEVLGRASARQCELFPQQALEETSPEYSCMSRYCFIRRETRESTRRPFVCIVA